MRTSAITSQVINEPPGPRRVVARLDRRVYSPLCLALAGLSALSALPDDGFRRA